MGKTVVINANEYHFETSGVVNPRKTTISRDAIVTPSVGLIIDNIDTNQLERWNGTTWVTSVAGNTLYTGDGTTLAGTSVSITDTLSFGFNLLYIHKADERIGIGTIPVAKLDIVGNGTTSSTRTFRLKGSSGIVFFEVLDDGTTDIGANLFKTDNINRSIGVNIGAGSVATFAINSLSTQGHGLAFGVYTDLLTSVLQIERATGLVTLGESVGKGSLKIRTASLLSTDYAIRVENGGTNALSFKDNKLSIGTVTTPTAMLHLKGYDDSGITKGMTYEDNSGNNLLEIDNGGGFTWNLAKKTTSRFTVYGTTGIGSIVPLLGVDPSEDCVVIGAAFSLSNDRTFLKIGASTAAKAHMWLEAGATVTTLSDGQIWFDGTNLNMRIGGVTKIIV